jgi:hypothetical protein
VLDQKISFGDKMQREYTIRQIAKRKGYHLEKTGDESYRLINGRLNVAVYQLDAVPLEAIALFLEHRTIRIAPKRA